MELELRHWSTFNVQRSSPAAADTCQPRKPTARDRKPLTEMGRSIPDEVSSQMLKAIPLGRFGEPEEIANVVLFLCSDLASYVTGQTLHVSGGWWV